MIELGCQALDLGPRIANLVKTSGIVRDRSHDLSGSKSSLLEPWWPCKDGSSVKSTYYCLDTTMLQNELLYTCLGIFAQRPFQSPLKLHSSTQHVPQQGQRLFSKPNHISLPVPAQPRFHLPRSRPSLPGNSKRNISSEPPRKPISPKKFIALSRTNLRRPILSPFSSWPGSTTFTNTPRTPQFSPHVLRHTSHNLWRRTCIYIDGRLGPACVGDARRECVKC